MNTNVKNIEISGIRKFYNKVIQVPDAISLTLGQPDFKAPLVVKNAMIKALEENKTVYTPNAGIPELRKEISKYLESMSINFSPDEVCVTVGGSEGLYATFQAILNPKDVILVPNPAYPAYKAIGALIGATVIEYNLDDKFSIDLDDLKNKIKEFKPKAMVLSYPSNPTGAVMEKALKEKLYSLLKDESLYIISDEIYASLSYEEEYYSLCQYEDLINRCIYVSGFSKMFSLTGLRIGYICAKDHILKEIMKVHQYNVSCAPSIAQYGAYEGLKNAMEDAESMKKEFILRRDYVYNYLIKLGFKCDKPKGAFYIFPDISTYQQNSEIFCSNMLNSAKVACVPGSAFGSRGENHIRISYCCSMKQLNESLENIEKWLYV